MITDGFYDGLNAQLDRIVNDGLIKEAVSEYIAYAGTPEEAIALVEGSPGMGPV